MLKCFLIPLAFLSVIFRTAARRTVKYGNPQIRKGGSIVLTTGGWRHNSSMSSIILTLALPSLVLAGIPGKPFTPTGFGALTYTTSPPTGLLGVGLGGDSSPRMIAVQGKLEF